MEGTIRTVLRLGVAVAAVSGLVAAGVNGAAAAPRKTASPYERPYIDPTINAKHLTAHTGGGAMSTGQVDLSLSAVGGEREIAVIRFANGYTFGDFRSDILTFGKSFGKNGPSKKGL